MNNQGTLLERLAKRVLGKRWEERAAVDPDKNAGVLRRLPAEDPVYTVVVDHALTTMQNELVAAMDTELPAERRVSHLDAAAGLRTYLLDLEARRAGWTAHQAAEDKEKAEGK